MTPRDRRASLRALSRHAEGGLVTVAHAALAWHVERRTAAHRLARLARSGWLESVRRGVYFIPPLEAGTKAVAEDPWVVADRMFAPCYIGGWSAAEHWELTEQIFRSTFVVTAASPRSREQTLLGNTYRLVRVKRARVESVKPVWHGRHRLRISSPERTLVDAFTSPSWVGGSRHLAQILSSYRDSAGASPASLVKELRSHGKGAAHKRAGLLCERLWPEAREVIAAALAGRSSGVIRLDPDTPARGRMNRRWGLWVNAEVGAAEG